MVHRQIEAQILKDLDSKIVLLSGPRQCGKTYLSRQLFADSQVYLNSDSPADRKVLREGSWDRLKEPKCYFYDTGRILDDPGARFENAVACHLLKRCHFLEDTLGERMALHYVRDKEKREVDFLTLRNQRPEWLIEAKWADADPAPSLVFYQHQIKPKKAIQLVRQGVRDKALPAIEIRSAASCLAGLEA